MDIIFKEQLKRNQTLSSEEPGSFLFEGVNASNSEVRVEKVVTSCGCTSTTYPKRIQPGETFQVVVVIDKRGSSGNFNQSASLTFSNGDQVKLKINGYIE
ncbi:MAG: DUF1573 domain-containing protein [Streptococcus sp.]|nr:DUF1573 domain-containing protein [Streptococcus sp.]